MRKHAGLKVALATTALASVASYGIHRYDDGRYFAVLPIVDVPNAALTPAQEEDARLGDAANDWLLLSLVLGASAAMFSIILAWKWLHPIASSVRGFDVIQ